jgi:hypothetical protein
MPSSISGGGLTTDAVMLYCASQLNHLDEGIKQHMAQQQVARNQADKLGTLKATLTGPISAGDSGRKAEVVKAMKEAYDSLPPNDPRRAKLDDTFHRFMDTVTFNDDSDQRVKEGSRYSLATLTDEQIGHVASNGTDGNETNDEEMKRFAADIEPMLSDVSKGAELAMIDLQSMISQRQMAVQIATQMISKLSETQMAIVSQIK